MVFKKMSLFVVCAAAALSLLLATQEARSSPPEKVRIFVGFDQIPGPAEQALVQAAGGTIIHSFHLVPAIAANVPAQALDGLSRNPHVAYIEEDAPAYAIVQTLPWGVDRIDAEVVHASGNKGTGVTAAIIDTGIDYLHPDLDANYKGGYDFVNLDADPMDDNGHGTHVAGTVAAEDNTEGVIGVAPEAWLYALKVLNASGSGYYSDIVAAVQWCADNGIQVANMSLGGSFDSLTLHAACDNAYAANVLLVAAAGNSGNQAGKGDNIGYPAAYGSVIAVGATKQDDTRASFSSTGPDLELVAPGVSILSTYLNSGYATGSGTSMASPHVAGTAALVFASGVPLAVDVRTLLDSTADDLGAAGLDEKYGYGIVDADEAAGGGAPPPPPPPPPTGLNATVTTDKDVYTLGDKIIITVTVTDQDLAPVAGAAVHIEVLTASLRLYVGDGTTGSDGIAGFGLKTKKPDGTSPPPYYIFAVATMDGLSAQASTQVTVN